VREQGETGDVYGDVPFGIAEDGEPLFLMIDEMHMITGDPKSPEFQEYLRELQGTIDARTRMLLAMDEDPYGEPEEP